jgi:hypothetical protein
MGISQSSTLYIALQFACQRIRLELVLHVPINPLCSLGSRPAMSNAWHAISRHEAVPSSLTSAAAAPWRMGMLDEPACQAPALSMLKSGALPTLVQDSALACRADFLSGV